MFRAGKDFGALEPDGCLPPPLTARPFRPAPGVPATKEDELIHFNHQHPTQIVFGYGRFTEIGSIVARFGRRCLLVSGPKTGALCAVYPKAKKVPGQAGVEFERFDGVIPNPTVETVSEGVKLAKAFQADVILGSWRRIEPRRRQSRCSRGNSRRLVLGLLVLQAETDRSNPSDDRGGHHGRHRFASHPGGGGDRCRHSGQVGALRRSSHPARRIGRPGADALGSGQGHGGNGVRCVLPRV